jgi:hypothetical protein
MVPRGMRLDFFTDEGSGLPIINLVELVRKTAPLVPMDSATEGTPVMNYVYEPFKPHQLAAINRFNRLDLPPAQFVLVGEGGQQAIRLCSTPGQCPVVGHTCDGLFGKAHRAGWTHLRIMSCRVDVEHEQEPTTALMDTLGKRTTAVYDAFLAWAMAFIPMAPVAKKHLWESISEDDRARYNAADDEIREWADCLATRTQIAAATTPAAKKAIAAAAPVATRLRLLRDHPEHHAMVAADIALTPVEQTAVTAFLALPMGKQQEAWFYLSVDDKVRRLSNTKVAEFAAAQNVIDMFSFNVRGDALYGLLRRLPDASRKIALSDPVVREHLEEHQPALLV